ncbi:MAG: thioredoxin family protein [Acidimicrobiales bacterium]
MSEAATVVEATKDNFGELTAEGTVLVDVWGPDCRPCLALAPHVDALAARYAGHISVIKLEAPKARRVCMGLRIMGMPAFLLFRDGVEVARLADPSLSAQRLNEWVDEQLGGHPCEDHVSEDQTRKEVS